MSIARSAETDRLTGARQTRVDQATFRSAHASHPAGVVVVTAQDEQGPMGLTATSFVSISLDPPLVGVAVDAGSATWDRLRHAQTMVVHMLGEEQHTLASRSATRDIDRFGSPTDWATLTTGEPLLSDVTTWMRCHIERRVSLGDHFLVVARVLDAFIDGEQAPLIYHQRGYHSVREHLS